MKLTNSHYIIHLAKFYDDYFLLIKKVLYFFFEHIIIYTAYGKVAQLARAHGSYP